MIEDVKKLWNTKCNGKSRCLDNGICNFSNVRFLKTSKYLALPFAVRSLDPNSRNLVICHEFQKEITEVPLILSKLSLMLGKHMSGVSE